jgi:hypothetical protein
MPYATPILIAVGGSLALLAGVIAVRWVKAVLWRRTLIAFRLNLPRNLTAAQVSGWLSVLSKTTMRRPVVQEITADRGSISYHLLVPQWMAYAALAQVRAALPGVRVESDGKYLRRDLTVRAACELRLTSTAHPLAHDRVEIAARAFVNSLQPLAPGQTIRISWILAGIMTPHPAGLVSLPADLARFKRLKHHEPLIRACARIAVTGGSRSIARRTLGRVFDALRILDAPGASVVRRAVPTWIISRRVRHRSLPLTIWPSIFNTRELVGLIGLRLGGIQAPGLTLGTARQLPPSPDTPRSGLVIARSNYPGMTDRPLALRTDDRLRHVWLLGPTGTGKSTLIANMVLQEATANRGLVVVDPKTDLIEEIASRLPEKRLRDVIWLDPASTGRPVGFNILGVGGDEQSRELVVDNVTSIFAEIWKSSWGPRTSDVFRNALLTLTTTRARDRSAFTLVEVAELLTNPAFRGFVTGQAGVPDTVRPFWMAYESMSDGERMQIIGPSLNKLRALTTRSSLRLLLGQSAGLDLWHVFSRRRILLVSLNKGIVGAETSRLLGSLLVSSLWHAALRRSGSSAALRRPVFAYLDEFQDVLRMGGELADVLSQARGLGLGLVLAHQYLDQLPRPVQSAVLGTVRSQVVFQLEYDDAKALERRFAPSLSVDDLTGLGAYEVAARLSVDGVTTAPVTGTTLPLPDRLRDPNLTARKSRELYGMPRADVEAALRERVVVAKHDTNARLGRRTNGDVL